MPAEDVRWARWVSQLDRIIQEAYWLHHYRQLWRGLAEITQAADLPASTIFDAFGVWYATTQTAAVRRQLDRTRGAVSLRRLLDDISLHPGVASRERHVDLWLSDDHALEAEAHANFDRFSGGRNLDQIDAALVRTDIETLNVVKPRVLQFSAVVPAWLRLTTVDPSAQRDP
jgi:hypothetical protein